MSQYALRRGLFGLGLFIVIAGISIPAHAQTPCNELLPNPECEANPCECIDELRNCSPRPPGFNDKINELEAACDQCLAQQEHFILFENEEDQKKEEVLEDPPRIEVDRCCACQYQDFPECAHYNDPENPETCNEARIITREAPKGEPVCQWDGSTMKCISINKLLCEQWKATKIRAGECDEETTFIMGRDVAALKGYRCLRLIRTGYYGHGRGCVKMGSHIDVCLNAAGPNCKALIHEEKSCSTFANEREADRYAEDLQAQLQSRAHLKNMKVKITGNQAVASIARHPDGEVIADMCATPLTYEVTCNDIHDIYPPCEEERTPCRRAGDRVRCTIQSGKNKGQMDYARCCFFCSQRRMVPFGKIIERGWTRGPHCNTKCSDYCSGYANSVGFTTSYACGQAKKAAEGEVKRCLDDAKSQCPGIFRTFNAQSKKVSESWISCIHSANESWECRDRY